MKTHGDLPSSSTAHTAKQIHPSSPTTDDKDPESVVEEDTWASLPEDERSRRVANFFERWKAPEQDLSHCLPDKELLLAAKQPDRDLWPSHIQECNRCRHLTELVGNRDRIPLNEILSITHRLAESKTRTVRRAFTPRKFVNTFYNSLRPRQVAIALVAFLVVTTISVNYYRSAFRRSNPVVVSVPEDNYWKATQWLSNANSRLEDGGLTYVKPLKQDEGSISQTISILEEKGLDNRQRAELGKLLAEYHNRIEILKRSTVTPGNSKEEPQDIPILLQTSDSAIVSQVWAAFGAAKRPATADPENLLNAMAMAQAAKEIDVTAITPNREVIVQDHLPRSDTDRSAIQERIDRLRDAGVDVKVNWLKEVSTSSQKEVSNVAGRALSPVAAKYHNKRKVTVGH